MEAPTRAPDPVLLDGDTPPPAPIIAAADASAGSGAAIDTAVEYGAEFDAPLVFIYVRRGPPGHLGAPVYQRRLTKEMHRARRVLERALLAARSAEVEAQGEILEGSPRRRILEFARDRGAQLIVVGSRRRRLGRSVACAVARAADRPVVVAGRRTNRLQTAAGSEQAPSEAARRLRASANDRTAADDSRLESGRPRRAVGSALR